MNQFLVFVICFLFTFLAHAQDTFFLASQRENPNFKIRIHKVKGQWEVGIESAGKRQAICEQGQGARSILDGVTEGQAEPVALTFKCMSTEFAALSTTATLIFEAPNRPVLRFGTWLQGYQEMSLRVEIDRLLSHQKRALGKALALR